MIRFLFGLALVALAFNAACSALNSESATPAVVTDTPVPAIAAAPTPLPKPSPVPPRSPCISAITPQPTQTPAIGALPRAATLVPPARLPIPSGKSQLLAAKFHAGSVDREMPLLIYLPPGYSDSPRRYPVLYMLSGFNGDRHEWVNMGMCDAVESLIRGGQIQPMIVVFPEGDSSWWFNHAPPPGGDGKPWGDYVWKDLVGYVDANYRTLKQPQSRAIGGLSAGGQSALMLAMTHPEVFNIVGAHSPSFRGADGSVPSFGDWDYFNQYDPFWLLEHGDAVRQLTLWIDVAAGDFQWRECNPPPSPQRCIQVFHDLLEARGIQHDWRNEWPGIHDEFYWRAHIGDYLIWYATKLVGEDIP